MTPIAQLIADLRELRAYLNGEGELNGFSFGERPAVERPFWWRRYLGRMEAAAEALARQEELLAEAGKVVAEAAGDIEGWGAYADDYFKDKHDLAGDVERYRRAAARLSDKLKGE